LIAVDKALCYECHSNKEEQKHVHPAISEGECVDCHSPHSTKNKFQLAGHYTTKRYTLFSSDEYELCFECHDETLVTAEYTRDKTNFRDGTSNLHFIHVKGKAKGGKYGLKMYNKKGRACFGCHMSHQSDQPFMLLEELASGKMMVYSMAYTKLQDGGNCVVGCHNPRKYNREIKGKEEEISVP
jgi:predicted CXXCH cytochrome family protein